MLSNHQIKKLLERAGRDFDFVKKNIKTYGELANHLESLGRKIEQNDGIIVLDSYQYEFLLYCTDEHVKFYWGKYIWVFDGSWTDSFDNWKDIDFRYEFENQAAHKARRSGLSLVVFDIKNKKGEL